MKKLLVVVAATITGLAVLGCDDYNIVEPRFYVEKDIVEIPVCVDTGVDCPPLFPKTLPKVSPPTSLFGMWGCWIDHSRRRMRVIYGVATRIPVEITLLGSGGDVLEIIVDESTEAGLHCAVVDLNGRDDGVYAICATFKAFKKDYGVEFWFEID